MSLMLVFYGAIFGKYLATQLRYGCIGTGNSAVNPAPGANVAQPTIEQTNTIILQRRRRYKMSRMLFLSAFWYALCFIPNNTVSSFRLQIFVQNHLFQLWLRTILLCGYVATPMGITSTIPWPLRHYRKLFYWLPWRLTWHLCDQIHNMWADLGKGSTHTVHEDCGQFSKPSSLKLLAPLANRT